jgi:hypothetical protein
VLPNGVPWLAGLGYFFGEMSVSDNRDIVSLFQNLCIMCLCLYIPTLLSIYRTHVRQEYGSWARGSRGRETAGAPRRDQRHKANLVTAPGRRIRFSHVFLALSTLPQISYVFSGNQCRNPWSCTNHMLLYMLLYWLSDYFLTMLG